MQLRAIRIFIDSAAALLLGMALAQFLANWASAGLVQPHEPVIGISMRNVFWIAGIIELIVGLICFFGQQIGLKVILLLWLATNFLVYQVGLVWVKESHGFSVYLTSLAEAFGIAPGTAYLLLKIVFLYLLIGSSVSLLWLRTGNSKAFLKVACIHCNGHVEFPAGGIGQQVKCPHCSSIITLAEPEGNLA
jgi:ribosomal protein S27E